MGREVRRVPADWEHPKDADGHYRPLHGGSISKRIAAWDEEKAKWDEGFIRGYDYSTPTNLSTTWEPKPSDACESFDDWDGERPDPNDYMPDWPESERTHYQMYETCSEGTPISPVMATPEELAHWLADTGASAFGGMTASYDGWLGTIKSKHGAVSMVLSVNGDQKTMMPGVELEAKNA